MKLKSLSVLCQFTKPEIAFDYAGLFPNVEFVNCSGEELINAAETRLNQGNKLLILVDDFSSTAVQLKSSSLKGEVFIGLIFGDMEHLWDQPNVSQFDLLLPLHALNEGFCGAIFNKIMTESYFGISILTQLPMNVVHKSLASSSQRSSFRKEIIEYVNDLAPALNRMLDGFGQFAAEIQEELLMNAIWDANPRLRNQDRREIAELTENESVHTTWGFDGETLHISVRDMFGTFDSEVVNRYKRFLFCSDKINAIRVQHEGAGAGIGFYMVLERLSGIVVTVQKDVSTEIVAMIKLAESPRFLSKKQKSFQHFFI